MTSANNGSGQVSIPQALQLAATHQANGQLQQAELLLRKVLAVDAGNVFALHLLGCIAHQAGNLNAAVQLLEQAISLQPNTALFHRNIAEMYRQQGKRDQAISHGRQSLTLEPANPTALSNLGIAYFDSGQYQQAIDHQQQALALDPTIVTALNNLGSIYRAQKQLNEAIDYYQQALAINPGYAESLNNLGAVFTEQANPEQGLALLQNAVQLNPAYAEAHRNLGSCYLLLEQTSPAQLAFQTALKLRPQFTEALLGLASIEQEANRYASAEQLIQQAIAADDHSAASYVQLAGLMNLMGFAERAHSHYQQALTLEPDNIPAHVGKSQLLTEQGLIEDAEQCLQQALAIDPQSVSVRINLAQLKKVRPEDSNFQYLKNEAAQLDSTAKTKAIGLHFALGKCHDDIGDYQQGFQHFLHACQLKRQKIHYSQSDNTLATLAIIATFTPQLIEQLSGCGHPSATPIFILGMPRSGTTLTEQIIASHPQCYGAGELADLSNLINSIDSSGAAERYPHSIKQLVPGQLKTLGERYVSGLQARQSDARFITDKMPSNYFYLGLIHLLLPNAKIIHVKRHPVDTCISNFSKLFKQGQHFSYQLSELGYYYRDYINLMQHWRSVLPANSFYELEYEQLVNNTEQEARQLIAYCAMDWDDRCLDFHRHSRAVRTASATQVRQPIYQTSVQRWRHYEDYIEPLLTALGDLLPAAD